MLTDFEKRVLALTKKIPRGKVTTYKIIAKKLNTKAYRAVGAALRKNKTPLIIPCHRVVNSDGTVGGYKGKKHSTEKIRLLNKERIIIKNNKINLKKYLCRL
jgi:methylated-DNA-[protein]-cysteine S-methyltransferase